SQGVAEGVLLEGGTIRRRGWQVDNAPAGLLRLGDAGHGVRGDEAQTHGPLEHAAEPIAIAVHGGIGQLALGWRPSLAEAGQKALGVPSRNLVELAIAEGADESLDLPSGGLIGTVLGLRPVLVLLAVLPKGHASPLSHLLTQGTCPFLLPLHC